MSRLIDRLLVALYIAIAALPVFAMIAHVRGRELAGAVEPRPLPVASVGAVLSEELQKGFAEWFESNLGLKGTSIALDNALLYHAFHETKPGAGVRIGKDGVLFSNEDIDFYNKYGAWLTDPAYVERLADQIASLQRRMRGKHRALIPVIIPAKTSVWRDKIPEAWMLDVSFPRPGDESTRMITQALQLRGVVFVDARYQFQTANVPREAVFGPDARHWSAYGACLAMREVVAGYVRLTGRPMQPYECVLDWIRITRLYDDYDLLRLLNAQWTYANAKQVPIAKREPVEPPPGGPSVLFVGTSFCWQIMRDAFASGQFSNARMNYYNQTFVEVTSDDRFPVEPGTPGWRERTMTPELVVLDLFEGYLGSPGSYVQQFLDNLTAELDARDQGPGIR